MAGALGLPKDVTASEGLALELKSWLDPERPEHKAVIVRTLLALRNHGGGVLLIGFTDNGKPRDDVPSYDVEQRYHPDRIQELVSRYASARFEVEVTLLEYEERRYPRIEVSSGIRTPVRVTTAIEQVRDGAPYSLLEAGEIPVRTLMTNGRPSTAACGAADWEQLMQVCFDNREADIGRFIRRHLGGVAPAVAELVAAVKSIPTPVDEAVATEFLQLGGERFTEAYARQNLLAGDLLRCGGREVALVISPQPTGFEATGDFLRRIVSSVPRLSTYPPWVDVLSGSGVARQAQVFQGRWESLLHDQNMFDLLTFALLDPAGRFYERRLLLRDVIARRADRQRRHSLGERETLTDVAETLVTGLEFARMMRVADEGHLLHWAFRWTGLTGRLVDTWFTASPSYYIAEEDTSPICRVSFAADTPAAALASMIRQVIAPMFAMFRGYEVPPQQIDETLAEVIERRSRF
jgi:hypothetical protein